MRLQAQKALRPNRGKEVRRTLARKPCVLALPKIKEYEKAAAQCLEEVTN